MRKVAAPGMALLSVGVLYIVSIVGMAAWSALSPPPDMAETERALRQAGLSAEQVDQGMRAIEWLEDDGVWVSAAIAVVGLLLAGLVVRAGLRMRQLRSYGTCVAGAIVAMFPCTTVSCCCMPALLGIPVGIWALVVLLQEDVRRAFAERAGGTAPV